MRRIKKYERPRWYMSILYSCIERLFRLEREEKLNPTEVILNQKTISTIVVKMQEIRIANEGYREIAEEFDRIKALLRSEKFAEYNDLDNLARV